MFSEVIATDVNTTIIISIIKLYICNLYYQSFGNEKFANDILLLHTFPHKGQLFGRACSILLWSSRNGLVFNHFSQLSLRKMSKNNLPSFQLLPTQSGTCTMKINLLLGKVLPSCAWTETSVFKASQIIQYALSSHDFRGLIYTQKSCHTLHKGGSVHSGGTACA